MSGLVINKSGKTRILLRFLVCCGGSDTAMGAKKSCLPKLIAEISKKFNPLFFNVQR